MPEHPEHIQDGPIVLSCNDTMQLVVIDRGVKKYLPLSVLVKDIKKALGQGEESEEEAPQT